MVEPQASGRPQRHALKKLVCAALTALVAWFIVAAWRQSHAAELEALTVATIATGAADPSRAELNMLAEHARQDPIASAPFIDGALIAARTGHDEKAAALMAHAVRLNPRDRTALAWLFTAEVRHGQYAAAIGHAHILYRLEPALEPILSRTLAILAQLDDLRALIVLEFRGTPFLGSILSAAPKDGLPEQVSLELIAALNPLDRAGWQERFLEDRLSEQDYAGVSAALRSFGNAGQAGENLLYDGSFRQLAGPRPFNWALNSDGDIHAAPVETGFAALPTALHIERFGLAAATAARQSLLVHAGRYRLSQLLKSADVTPDPSQSPPFIWAVSCPGLPHPELGHFSFGPNSEPHWTAQSWTFDVPSSCALIEIALSSSFSDVAVHADAYLTRVRLERAS